MRKISTLLKKAVHILLVVALVASILPVGVFAATDDYSGPSIVGVSLNEQRTVATLSFDKEIEAATSSFKNKIKLSQGGASLSVLSFKTVEVSGFKMVITMNSPLNKSDNFFEIAANSLLNQSIAIQSGLFDARGPSLADTNSVVVNSAENTVTLKFKTPIKGYPNDDALKNGYITLARNGTSFTEIIHEDCIEIDGSKGEIIITLDEGLAGTKSKFKIAAGKLVNANNGNINTEDIVTAAINVNSTSSSNTTIITAPPEIDYTTISSDLKTVTIYFTEKIKNAFATGASSSLASNLLKSHVWISRNSKTNYDILSGSDTITVSSNYVKIVFSEPLTASRNYIKFDANSLTDYNDNPINEVFITDSISGSSSSTSAPAYASASISGNNKIIVYFTIPVIKNSSITTSELRSSIFISRNGGSYNALTTSDAISVSGNTLTVTLSAPLSGSNNRLRILANAITSKTGIPLNGTVTTSALSYTGGQSYYADEPEYSYTHYDASASRLKIYFENDILATSSASLKNNILISRNGSAFQSLSVSDVVTISPQNAITILLAEPLTGTKNAIRIVGNTIKDYESGYVLNDAITTEYITVGSSSSTDDDDDYRPSSGTTQYSNDVVTELSDDLYSITLKFNEPLYNNLDSLEDLKNKIQISTKGRFSSLTTDDYIRINEEDNELIIILAEPAKDYFSQIKILSGALRNASGNSISNAIVTLPLGEADGSARAYLNDSALTGAVSLEEGSNSVTATLANESDITSLTKKVDFLVKLPNKKSSATLNLSSNVIEALKKYGSSIALSLGDVTYYLPAANITTLATGDMLSLTINKASSASQNLSSAASKNSFTVVSPAANISASVVSSLGTKTAVKHTVFSNKRFLVASPDSDVSYTAVRIEASGTVVPVPSNTETSSGILYISSKTLSDGNYAAISAKHTFANTPSWVQTPANILGSRLILSNINGSDLNASQAISRSETVTIMSKTLGILADTNGASPFFDMISTDSYFASVMSAVSHKLISGYPDGTFKPASTLTRAEAMTIVARALRFMNGKSVSASPDMTLSEANSILSKFTDGATVDNWAKIDIAECVQAGVVNGDNNGRLNPKSNVTRAELIQLMYNILNKSDML